MAGSEGAYSVSAFSADGACSHICCIGVGGYIFSPGLVGLGKVPKKCEMRALILLLVEWGFPIIWCIYIETWAVWFLEPGRLADKDRGLWTLRREFESRPGYYVPDSSFCARGLVCTINDCPMWFL